MRSGVIDMRLLELRSGLFFEYPKLLNTGKNLLFFLPFWENPIISERKEARLVEYNMINRGSSMFAHTGATARSITIEFYLTVPHIMRSINSVINARRLIESLSSEKEKERFNNINPFENEVKTTVAEKVVQKWKELALETHLGRVGTPAGVPQPSELDTVYPDSFDSFDQRVGVSQDGPITTTEYFESGVAIRDVDASLIPTNISPTALRAINSAVYILETIRTSVAGHSKLSVLGPPLLRLRHGASYNDVPLIVKDYDIGVEEEAGYDLKTLLPNRIRITLNTAEVRSGDFQSFNPGSPTKRDTIAGWEAILDPKKGTTDPGYLQ